MREFSCAIQDVTIHIDGLFLYNDEHGVKAAEAFLKDFLNRKSPFDDALGSYLVRIDYPDGRQVFFSDNSGMRRFFINPSECRFESTFLAAMPKENKEPNYAAIAQFLYFGCVYDSETIERHVVLSNPESYYEVTEGKIEEKSKNLIPMDNLETDELVMEKVMKEVCKALSDYKRYYCTITGGTDSRSVLAHLLYNHLRPNLDITGRSNHTDVEIAKKIAEETGLDLLFVSDDTEKGWLLEAIAAAKMGMTGVCSSYRLYKKAKKLKTYDEVAECGGLAGEMFKNSFINQDFPFYGGSPDWERFIKYKVMYFDFPMRICGETIKREILGMKEMLKDWLSQFDKQNKAAAYLAAGYVILQQRSAGMATINAQHYVAYSPLIERRIAAYGFRKSPYTLEMQAFQRKQVSHYCPKIKSIRTDRGLSCDEGKMLSEWAKSTWFLFKVWLKRLINRKTVSGRIDICFQQGLHSPQYEQAFKRCRELGIVSSTSAARDVPEVIADRLFLIGSIL